MELLQNVVGTMRFPGPDDDPVTFAADPTVTVTRHSDGSAIVTDKATTKVEEEGEDTFYTVELSGEDLSEVNLLVAVWTDGVSSYTTTAEVVGGFVTSLKAIKEKYNNDPERTAAQIAAAREAATTQIEGACSVAFRPRYGKEVLDGSGSRNLLLRQPQLLRVLSVSVDGEPIDVDDLALDSAGVLLSPSRWTEGRANVEVAYVHGYTRFPAADLPVRDLAAFLLTKHPNDWHERATSYSTDSGSYTLVTPGVRGASFPIPSVNAFVEANQFPSVA
jgi:hypothetical protein